MIVLAHPLARDEGLLLSGLGGLTGLGERGCEAASRTLRALECAEIHQTPEKTTLRAMPAGVRAPENHWYELMRLRITLERRLRDLRMPEDPHAIRHRHWGEPLGEALP